MTFAVSWGSIGPMDGTPPGHLLTEAERARARQLLDEDWIAASLWVNGRVSAPTEIGLLALAELAGPIQQGGRQK